MLCLLAMAGRFGLTKEVVTQESNGSYMYPSYEKKVKPRPSPRAWCWTVLQQLDIGQCFQVDLRQEFGQNYIWCLIGLREAAERASLDGSFLWLRVIPLLKKHKQMVSAATRGAIKKRSAEFMKVADSIRLM